MWQKIKDWFKNNDHVELDGWKANAVLFLSVYGAISLLNDVISWF